MIRTMTPSAWIRSTALFLMVLFCAFPSCAAPPPSLNVQWVGTYSVDSARRLPEQASPTGIRLVGRGARPIQLTKSVKPELGSSFGVGYVLQDAPSGEVISLRHVWRYPDGGLTNPANGKTYKSTESESRCSNNRACFIGYKFTESWEQVAGTWTAEIWYGDKLLLTQEFTVAATPGMLGMSSVPPANVN